jgi:hypothetical protein
MLVITTTLEYPDAVGEARMLQPLHKGASPRIEAPRPGFEVAVALSAEVETMGEG